ncbi:hypothetical protein GCM10011351_15800 [Paraliobacillus quinghaiensis]|uniref:LrgB n=1 Tax=Paraliobacillus quinghaiensis TaxID=470815 RepID=A0A917TNM4_9BACI|nr:LrgB family protein [Paraliobacillus quinghaiensis]GGM30501.1 hypothetical protein GCM10011351_15800 [Paraliobacillus quinghaiensis]
MIFLFVTILTYGLYKLAKQLTKKVDFPLFHPLLLTPALLIGAIFTLNISVSDYTEGAFLLTHMLGPATIAFAIPVYKHLSVLKKHIGLILISVTAGSLIAIFSSFGLAILLKMEHHFLISLLPRSITTPLAMEVSTGIGGQPSLTIIFVIMTGILGGVMGPAVFKLFGVKSPIAKGLALGMSAHAVGTNRAIEYGEEATTFSTLAMILAGVITILIFEAVPVTSRFLLFFVN